MVEKTDLLKSVWPDTFVEENNLARHISILRKEFQQRGGQQNIISTIPGHGYMFVAPVIELPQEIHEDTAPQPEAGAARDSVTRNESAVVPAIARPTVPPLFALAVLVFVGVSAVVLASLVMGRHPATPAARLPEQLTFESALQIDPVWSPDGSSLVYATDRTGNLDLYRRTLGDPTPIRLTSDPSNESQADWSPDGQWLAFRSDTNPGGIYIMPASGGSARRLTDFGFHPRWSADGTKILFADSILDDIHRGFFVVTSDGRELRPVRPDLLARSRSAYVSWHPDGKRVSIAGETPSGWKFITASLDAADTVTSLMPVDVANRLRGRKLMLGQFVWSNTGRDLFFEGQTEGTYAIWRVAVDPGTLASSTAPAPVYSGPGKYGDLALSRDGRRLAFTASNERTRVWGFPFDPSAGTLKGPGEPVTPGGPAEYDAAALLDGSKVAYRAARGNRLELWEQSLAGDGGRRLLSNSESSYSSPRWSRDGTQLAYRRSQLRPDGPAVTPALAILQVAAGAEQLLSLPAEIDLVPDDWSADGSRILSACRRDRQQTWYTCLMQMQGGEIKSIREISRDPAKNLYCQRFSPDERWVSFIAIDVDRPGVSTIHVMPTAGGPWTPVTEGRFFDNKPRWSPDGRVLYFISSRGGTLNIWGRRIDPDTGRPTGEVFRVTSFNGTDRSIPRTSVRVEIAISTNRLFVPITETSGSIWMLDGLGR